ncbi:MAG: hypothetical protein K0Q43_4352 [Ramlibacter sp.]|jgi:hypothetical protein|nr:hypothetical protein [Ramlibacter sp.]
MHNAPSVSYPAGRSRLAAALLLGVWLLGCVAASLWQFHRPDAWRLAAMLAMLLAAGAFAAWHWLHTPNGTLAWDGEGWTWSVHPQATAANLEVGLDLQRSLLLRWRVGGASQWIWLDRDTRAERWDDVRRAVYSRARSKALPQAPRPAATP